MLENPHYRGLGWEQLRWMFTTCLNGSCMPLNWVTYGLDYILWGMNPRGYHFTSLLVHAANALLFYFLSLRLIRLGLGRSRSLPDLPIRFAAAFSTLFFSLHPLQAEVVAWTIGREVAIAGFFFILTLLCYLKAAENESARLSRIRWMVGAWILYAMSLLGKEMALTLPFALLVLDIYPLRRLGGGRGRWFGPEVRQVWWEKVPFLLLALAAGVRATLEKEQAGSLYPVTDYGLLPRFAQVLYSLAFYLWKTLVPVGFSPLYPVQPFTGLWNAPTLLSGALVILLTAVLFFFRRRWPAGLAVWVFYGVLLLPVSGVVAFGPYAVADRFSYLPSLGWAILAGAGFFYCGRAWDKGRVGLRTLVLTPTLAVLVLLALGVLTWRQTQIWHDSERLWKHALALNERSSFAHNNLGLALAERGAFAEAIKHIRRAVEIDPRFVEAHANLGNFLAQRGSPAEAIHHLHQALEIDPAFANAHNTLGNILVERGELDKAIEHFRKALEAKPESAMTYYNLGRALAKRGNAAGAIANYRKALEYSPDDPDVHNNLGLVFQSQGKLPEAVEQFQNALQADPRYAKAYFNLGRILAGQEKFSEAVENFRRALQIQPGAAQIHEQLARALARQGKKDEALEHYQEALRLVKSRRE
ncbi:MAG TPA: tetratricopeptide repeat protein [Candidatus Binatia bacterium]|nr:tetratricopeptide repeat protein [Candidatus Binatia bacterium]